MSLPHFSSLISKKTIIMGESGVGKTFISTLFVLYCLKHSYPLKNLTILDFAPEKRIVKDRYIGGRIVESFNEILLEYTNLSPEIELMKSQILEGEQILPPRLLGQNSMEVLENCYSNFKICNSLLLNYLQNPTPILIINDIGIFLHLGGLRTVEKALNLSTTALINAYYGDFIADDYGSYISRREKIMLGLLARKMETIYFNKPLREKLLW